MARDVDRKAASRRLAAALQDASDQLSFLDPECLILAENVEVLRGLLAFKLLL
jgi:hypothetical protein